MDFRTKFITEKDREKIRLAVKLHTPVEVTSYTLPREMELYIQEVLMVFLSECHQEHMSDNLVFCLSELLTNAKKANTKRVYFKEQNLDINNEMDYHQGMVTFKDDTLNNIEHYLKEQKRQGLYVRFCLQLYDSGVKIEIRNNSILTIFEQQRINEKLKMAKKYEDPKQVMSKVIDLTEGAGLGIIIMVLMLKKIGMTSDNFQIFSTDKETITQILLPLSPEIDKHMDLLYEEFAGDLDVVPVFEDSLQELAKIAKKNPNDSQPLIDYISNDAFLTSIILKDASENGACCSKITQAFDALGRDKILQVLSKDNSKLRLIKKQKEIQQFWKHESDVAFYAYNLAQNFSDAAVDKEEVYICGLLHDIECLCLKAASDEQKDKVKKLASTLDESGRLYELFINDFGHSRGCYMLVQKWGLPEKISQVILFHNNPSFTDEQFKPLVYIIYLADILQYYNNSQTDFYQINKDVLKFFNIDSKAKLDYIVKQLKK
ncbi:MAG: HDOD domain-containing protein [Treponema sp.]|nr:HDOD domain-containing protein [Treponema sp.]